MRIIDLYDLKNNKTKRKRVKESLISDIESLAEMKFKGNEFDKFAIKIKLVKISRYC